MERKYTTSLSRILKAYTPVDEQTVDLIFDSGTIEDFRKDEVVFHENRFNDYEYFQLEGISHRFNINSEKELVTTGIYQGEVVITPYFARTANQQSLFSLQALIDSVFLKVPMQKFDELLIRNHQIGISGELIVKKEFARSFAFEILFRTSTAKERLLYFRTHYPQLENIIPHSIIASFLGITPVSLSRLRSELTQS